MKKGWEYKKLGEVCRKSNNIKWDDVPNDASYRYIDLTSVDRSDLCIHNPQYIKKDNAPSRAKQIIKAGDIIFATTRPTLRRVSLIDEKYDGDICSTGFCVLRPNVGVKSKLIFYALQEDGFYKYIEPLQTGANYPAVTDNIVKNYIIPIPPLSEQQSIVDYLDSAFAKIDAMKANAEKALNEAKALFQASLKEMLEPKEGWEEKKLGALTSKIGSGATPKGGRKVYIDEGCHLIRSMNVQYNEFKYEELAHITDDAANQLKGVEIQENDVLFNITGASIARCCVVPDDVLPARVNQHVSILRLKQEVLPRFLSYILNSPKHQRELLKIGEAGSTRQALTKTDLENHVIHYPNLDCQTNLLNTLDSFKSKVDRLQENYEKISQECDALKQAILRQVFE